MNPWNGLLKKEFFLLRNALLTGFALLIVAFAASAIFSAALEEKDLLAAGAISSAFLHMFYMPLFLLISLSSEQKQMNLWLYNPQPVGVLIVSKMLVILGGMVVSLLITGIYGVTVLSRFPPAQQPFDLSGLLLLGSAAAVLIIATSIYLSLWLLLGWSVFFATRTYIGNWSWLAVGLLFIALQFVTEWFQNTAAYEATAHWGKIELAPLTEPLGEVSTFHFYSGGLIFTALFAILMFLVSAWLIDRKVEV